MGGEGWEGPHTLHRKRTRKNAHLSACLSNRFAVVVESCAHEKDKVSYDDIVYLRSLCQSTVCYGGFPTLPVVPCREYATVLSATETFPGIVHRVPPATGAVKYRAWWFFLCYYIAVASFIDLIIVPPAGQRFGVPPRLAFLIGLIIVPPTGQCVSASTPPRLASLIGLMIFPPAEQRFDTLPSGALGWLDRTAHGTASCMVPPPPGILVGLIRSARSKRFGAARLVFRLA